MAASSLAQGQTSVSGVQVVDASPQGAVDVLTRLSLVFDHPVAPLASLGQPVDDKAFRVEPDLDGRAHWLNSRTLVFQFEDTPKPGTEIRYRLDPKELKTRAQIGGDLEWTVRYQPPRLLWSHPDPQAAFDLRLDNVILAFSTAPDPGALSQLTFTPADGPSLPASVRILPREDWAAAGFEPSSLTAAHAPPVVVELSPPRPIDGAGTYELHLDGTLGFVDTALSLETPARFIFEVPGPPVVKEARARDGVIEIRTSQPVVFGSMQAAVSIEPASLDWQLEPADLMSSPPSSATDEFRILGLAGEAVELTVAPAFVDTAGLRANGPFSARLEVPHLPPVLDIQPPSGAIIPSAREFFAVRARNVQDVDIRAAWITNDEIPYLHTFATTGQAPTQPSGGAWAHPGNRGWNLEDTWTAPSFHSDTLHVWSRTFGAIEQRPHDAQALWVEASALHSFGDGSQQDTLHVRRIFQIATLGLQVKLSRRHGLAWVSDLGTGDPLPSTDVSLFALLPTPEVSDPLDTPVWRGRTDENGLVWMPGIDALASRGVPRLALAENHAQRVWLALDEAETAIAQRDGGAVDGEGLRLAAAIVHDRASYHAGDPIHWKAYVRALAPKTLRVSAGTPLRIVLRNTDDVVVSADLETNHIGSAAGQLDLPHRLPAGTYTLELRFRSAAGETPIGAGTLQVADDVDTPWTITWDDELPKRERQGRSVTLSGVLTDASAIGIPDLELEWQANAQPAESLLPQWDGYGATDALTLESPASILAGQNAGRALAGTVETRRDGRFQIEFDLPENPASDLLLDLQVRPSQSPLPPRGHRYELLALRETETRAIVGVDPFRDAATLAWNWGVLDRDGTLLEGQPVTVELYQARAMESPAGTPTWERLSSRQLESAASIRTFTVEAPEPGSFALRIIPGNSGSPASCGLDVSVRLANSKASPDNAAAASMPVQLTADGRTARIEVPTPPGPASALLTVENGELVRARVAPIRGTPEMDVPLDATVTTHAGIHASVVGADASRARTGSDLRRRLPYRDRARSEISRPATTARANLRLQPDSSQPRPGSELHLALELSDADDTPVAGDLTVWMVRLDEPLAQPQIESSAPHTPEFNPGLALLDRWFGDVPTWDSRDDLLVAPEIEPVTAAPPHSSTDPARSSVSTPLGATALPIGNTAPNVSPRLPTGATVYWSPNVAIGKGGRTQIGISLPESPGEYAIFASAATASGAFAGAVLPLDLRSPVTLQANAPAWIRSGDLFQSTCRVVNESDRDLKGVLSVNAWGGRLVGKDRHPIDLAPGESGLFPARIESITAAELEGSADQSQNNHHSSASDILVTAGEQITLAFEFIREDGGDATAEPPRVERVVRIHDLGTPDDRIQTGAATPRASAELDLDDPDLLLAGEVEVRLSPSFAGLLEVPLQHLCEMNPTSTEEWISHAFGLLGWLRLDPYLDSNPTLAQERILQLERAAHELQSRWNGEFLTMWTGSESRPAPHQAYLRGMLYWVLNEIAATGVDVSPEITAALERSFHRDSHDSAQRGAPWLNDLAFHTWLRAEYGTEDPKVDISDLEGLVVRQELFGDSGRVYLGLAYHATLRDGNAPRQERALRARIQAIADALARSGTGETVLQLGDPAGPLTYASSRDDRLRSSALGVLLFSRIAPNAALMPNLVHTLLAARIDGNWPNAHESAHAVWALREYVEQVEHLRLPVQGRVVPGLGRAANTAFTRQSARPTIVHYTIDELSRVRRRDRTSSQIPLTFETSGVDPLYFTVRVPVPYPEGGLPYDHGLGVTRLFASASKAQTWSHPSDDSEPTVQLHRGHPFWVHLFISVPENATMVSVEDERIPGTTLLGRVEGAGVVESTMTEDTVTVVLADLEPGVHEVRYPVIPTVEGRYRLPAPRVRQPYEPGRRGGDAMISIEVRP